MVTSVFVIGLFNLVAGFALAMLADGRWMLVLPAWPRRGAASGPGLEAGHEAADQPAGLDDLPSDWISRLEKARVSPRGVVESLAWVILLDVRQARDSLVSALAPLDAKTFNNAAGAWLDSLRGWIDLAGEQKGDSAEGRLAGRIEELLLDQQYRAQSGVDTLAEGSPTKVSAAVLKCVDSLDVVRDTTAVQLAELLREQQRLDHLDESWLQDVPSGVRTRLGLEKLLSDWIGSDPECVRIASCVLMDVDRVGQLNETHGVAVVDSLLAEFGPFLMELVRKDRGRDRVARYGGQSYLLFFGDTSVSNAANGAERIRQTIEATTFGWEKTPINCSATFGVAELMRGEPLPEFLNRLQLTLKEGKLAGRDRTFVDNGAGPCAVKVSPYQLVQRRKIPLRPLATPR